MMMRDLRSWPALALVYVILVVPSSAQEKREWWNDGWSHRRTVTVKNRTEKAWAAGSLAVITVDLDYLCMSGKMKEDLADLRLVARGTETPIMLSRLFDRTYRLTFRLSREIAPGESDGYDFYYGNPNAAMPASDPATMGFVERFASGKVDPKIVEIAPAFTQEIKEGKLILTSKGDAPAGEHAIRIVDPPSWDAFDAGISFKYEPPPGAGHEVSMVVGFGVKGAAGEELAKRIEQLIAELGDNEWAKREAAGKELEKIGASAIEPLRKALSSEDAEIRLRAGKILENIRKVDAVSEAAVGIVRRREDITQINASIGKRTIQLGASLPASIPLQILRDSSRQVSIVWDKRSVLTERMEQPIADLRLVVRNASPGPLGKIAIEEIHVIPTVDIKPSYVIEGEETEER